MKLYHAIPRRFDAEATELYSFNAYEVTLIYIYSPPIMLTFQPNI